MPGESGDGCLRSAQDDLCGCGREGDALACHLAGHRGAAAAQSSAALQEAGSGAGCRDLCDRGGGCTGGGCRVMGGFHFASAHFLRRDLNWRV